MDTSIKNITSSKEIEKKMVNPELGLDRSACRVVADEIESLLADSYMLMVKTQNYHWNVIGNAFVTVHNFTENQYNDLFKAVDIIAERVRILGFKVKGTINDFIIKSTVGTPSNELSLTEMIADLLGSHQLLIKTCRKVIKTAAEYSDEGTVDLATERLQYHEKTAWLLRSCLEK